MRERNQTIIKFFSPPLKKKKNQLIIGLTTGDYRWQGMVVSPIYNFLLTTLMQFVLYTSE